MADDRERRTDTGSQGAADRDPAAIRAEIDQTRARISRDLDEIGERLNPQQVKQQIKDNIREATIGRVEDMARGAADRVNEARRGIMDTVRENPIPAAMAAIGIGWLYINGRKQDGASGARARRFEQYPEATYGSLSAYTPPPRGYAAYEAQPSEAGTQEQGKLDKVKETAGAVGENLKEKVGGVAEGAQHAAERIVDVNRRQARRAEDMFFDNPLALGAATVALGVAAGLAAPRTHTEVKLVGEVRDQVVDKVSEAATETADKAQSAVERAFEDSGGGGQQQAEQTAR